MLSPSLFLNTMNEEQNILASYIALRVKQLRRERNISQTTLTFDTDLNIGRIESCQNVISLVTILRLCKYFNISISEFFKGLTEY